MQLKIKKFTWQIINKSLDARKKQNIHWVIRVGIYSDEIKENNTKPDTGLNIEYRKRNKKVVIAGSGPAGFFAAYTLQKAGFNTVILERGTDVQKRSEEILHFEKSGKFSPVSNYSFGEGGAGTFSDGKLTSRSKHISSERNYIISNYVKAGAPEEISYLSHPHIGSDNLKIVVKNLREDYLLHGGNIHFETLVSDLSLTGKKVNDAITDKKLFKADYFIIAPGHSSYETYRMLMYKGVPFRTKNFAVGYRAEHRQEVINKAQWGVEKLKGVKAAEYRLTSDGDGKHQVYTFCMCPGGIVVPATAYEYTNIVNGMSYYQRNGKFANAACVAGIHPDELFGKKVTPFDALAYLEQLERLFYNFSNGYIAPFCTIKDFLNGTVKTDHHETSYPLGITPAPLWQMLPPVIVNAIREGVRNFNKKLSGFDSGILLGLESKTSSPVQVIRDKSGLCEGFDNLYIAGEGSGYSGGIISSAADGVKIALNIIMSV